MSGGITGAKRTTELKIPKHVPEVGWNKTDCLIFALNALMVTSVKRRAITLSLLALSSCTSLKVARQKVHLDKNYCNQQAVFKYTENELPKPIHSIDISPLLKERISHQSLTTANAIGLLDLLTKYVTSLTRHKSNPTLEEKVTIIDLSHKINQAINNASLEISAVASRLDCEEERAAQFAYYLKEKEDNTENKLVIGSIILGAVGSISAEMPPDTPEGRNTSSGIVIGSSLAGATLGILMLTNKKSIDFYHPINPLTDIWKSPAVSNYYPPSVWYYLVHLNPDNQKSLANLLVEKWMLFGQTKEVKDKNKDETYALFFGEGGKYSSTQLKLRADMLDQVEAYVTLMKQDLKTLSLEVENLPVGK